MVRAGFREGAKIKRWRARLDAPTSLLNQIGVMMVAESQQAFRYQRFGRERWEPRSVPNVFGIIADFHAGKPKPPNRRFQPRPALIDTRTMQRTLAHRIVGPNTVEVGSPQTYSGVLHSGGQVKSKPITERVRASLWEWLQSSGKRWKRQLGWLLNRKFRGVQLTTEVPARPMVGVTPKTIAFVKEAIGVEIFEVR